MDIEKNQIHALFDEFYKAVIPEMRPMHIYKYDYEGQKRFWFERFREAFFSEQPSLKNQSYTELPVMWLAGFRNKASAVPEGYVVVPKEPTYRMISAGDDVQAIPNEWVEVCDVYKAMIEAAQDQS